MMKIYKYPLEITDYQAVKIPSPRTILSVGNQDGKLVMWAMVDPELSVRDGSVNVTIVGTGNPIDDNATLGNFLGTVQMDNGLVWHVFYTVS